MKKTLAKWVTATTLALTVIAATETTDVLASKKENNTDFTSIHVVYQGQEMNSDGVQLVKDNLIVPVQALAESNGGSIAINGKILTATYGDLSYSMKLHQRFFQVGSDGMLYAIIPSKIFSGKAINSLKFIERTLGVELDYNEKENTLYIN